MSDYYLPMSDYSSYIHHAFLEPIRSVTVVDDEFPTLLKLIDGKDQYKEENTLRLLDIIKICRLPQNNWLLEVYDGTETPGAVELSHKLRHSDFLILDYHLNGKDDVPDEKALEIISTLAATPHFNLVVVYTQGYNREQERFKEVIEDIICSLSYIDAANFGPDCLLQQTQNLIDAWSIEDGEIDKKLDGSISIIDLLSLIRDHGYKVKDYLSSRFLGEFQTLYSLENRPTKLQEIPLLKWLFHSKISKIQAKFCQKDHPGFLWNISPDINWIQTDSLFLTVVHKEEPALNLPVKLHDALKNCDPHPHKLLLTRLRYEIDEQGTALSNEILANKNLQAHWLNDLFEKDPEERAHKIWSVICKHWEELSLKTKNSLLEFADGMVKALPGDKESLLARFADSHALSDIQSQKLHSNCFNCSQRVQGYHLTTGHVLEIKDGTNANYWLCLTPACDLVPEQKRYHGSNIPLTLVRLFDIKSACQKESDVVEDEKTKIKKKIKITDNEALTRALNKVNSNKLLFMKLGDDETITCLSAVANIFNDANPTIQEVLADNHGIFSPETFEISIYQTGKAKYTSRPIYDKKKAKVVSQLRYEYAISLLQLIGSTKSRVGLGFV